MLGVRQLHHQDLQHLPDTLPADGSTLVPLPPTWGTHLHLQGHGHPCAEQLAGTGLAWRQHPPQPILHSSLPSVAPPHLLP